VVARRGVDQAPVDVRTAFGRERLAAYVWPDPPKLLCLTACALCIVGFSRCHTAHLDYR